MMRTTMTPTRMITMRRPTTAMTMMLISSDFVGRPTFGQHICVVAVLPTPNPYAFKFASLGLLN